MKTNFIGQPVKHISLGKGVITDVSQGFVTIIFSETEKKFPFPGAFSNYLTLKDQDKQRELDETNVQIAAEKEAAIKKENERLRIERKHRFMKIDEKSQAVFNIQSTELYDIIKRGSLFSGRYLTGDSKGEPRLPGRIQPNSVCLLTALPDGEGEPYRRILGIMMTAEDFWGEDCTDGRIIGHEKYKIIIPSDINILFWDYFEHQRAIPRWGNVPFKYFSTDTMKRIFLDLIEIFTGREEETMIKEFYQYFCRLNRLENEEG